MSSLRTQHGDPNRGSNPRPVDPEVEVLTTRPLRPSTLRYTINVTMMQVADVGRTILISNVPLFNNFASCHFGTMWSCSTGYQALARSICRCGLEPGLGHKRDKLCLRGVVFFLANFPLFSDLKHDWAKMHQNILRGRNPRLSHTNRSFRMQSG